MVYVLRVSKEEGIIIWSVCFIIEKQGYFISKEMIICNWTLIQHCFRVRRRKQVHRLLTRTDRDIFIATPRYFSSDTRTTTELDLNSLLYSPEFAAADSLPFVL